MSADRPAAPRVLLASMPWMMPYIPCLAAATLREILAEAGIASDTLYGSLLFPRISHNLYLLHHYATFLFVPALHADADPEELIEHGRRWYESETFERGVRAYGDADVRAMLRADFPRAIETLDRCFARAARPEYDVVGFSVTFETQTAASLALARRLKAWNPAIKVMFGGAACLGEHARGLLSSFPEVDAVCHTEGEGVIVPLVRALRGEGALRDVPGIAYRDDDGRVRWTEAPPLLPDLDELPVPRYDEFLAQRADSAWRDVPWKGFFETSRGCWWGQKKPCSFCGLNNVCLTYRSKSPERAFREIATHHRRYPDADAMMATDAALDLRYLDTVFPRLEALQRETGRRLRLYYSVRPNLTRDHLATLARAGVGQIQPGVESFSDGVLTLMNKGVTAIRNVQLVKWSYSAGLPIVYNVIVGTPGEREAHYDEMRRLLPFIDHLPPPTGIPRMMLMRFSPYFDDPAAHGLRNVRPKAHYRALFRQPDADLARIAYLFDFDEAPRDDHGACDAALARLIDGFYRWKNDWREDRAFWFAEGPERVVAVDRRPGRTPIAREGGVAARLFRFLDQVRPRAATFEEASDVEAPFVACALARWEHRRWLYRDTRDRCLVVLPERRASR